MCINQLQRDTVLVTDVAGRVEGALAERWDAQGEGLSAQIGSLRDRGVDEKVVRMLHYLRIERNNVIHHPRRELGDRQKFREFTETVLPVIEQSRSPEDFLDKVLRTSLEGRFDAIDRKLDSISDLLDRKTGSPKRFLE